jgi:hypothetical protein
MAGALSAMIAAIFSGGVTSDPFFEYTTLLLPGNGTNGAQNNTFLDGSTNNFTITRNGNTTQGTFSPFSQTGWGNYFDGTNDYLTSASNADYNLGTTFSVEGWIYSQAATKQVLANLSGFVYIIEGNGTLNFYNGSSLFGGSGATVSRNTWVHVVFTRDASNVVRGFVNGVLTWAITVSTGTSQTAVFIGSEGGTQSFVNGYLSNVRIVKGAIPTSYQTSSTTAGTTIFTPPTSALTAISGTSLLTCQSNRFVDNSTTPKTITPTNGPTVVAFSPFNPTASWSAATNGGSGYFDGNGDFLQLSANTAFAFGTGDFTFDCWVYPLASQSALFTMTTSGVNDLVITNNTNPNTAGTTSGTASVTMGSTPITGPANAVVQNAWNHIAVVRSSGSVRVYVNGAGGTQTTNTTSVSGSYAPRIGALYSHASSATQACYMSNMRLVKGTAVYNPSQSTITVPTAPTTAITNTSLLLNFTNANIYDATSKNDLETVGNAQISTAISAKWGSGSMYFDGTGDWLDALAPNQLFNLSSGDWTIEAWIYRNASGAAHTILSLYNTAGSNTGLTFYVNASNQLVTDNGATAALAAGTVASGQWVYVAIVRSGSTTTGYINGSSVGTTAQAPSASQYARIGALATGASAFNGYIQDLRITKGYARTIATPTAAFPTL